MTDSQQDRHQIPKSGESSPVSRNPLRLLNQEQARAALAAAKGHDYEVVLMLALVLGLRASELLALQWQTIDWEAGSLAKQSL